MLVSSKEDGIHLERGRSKRLSVLKFTFSLFKELKPVIATRLFSLLSISGAGGKCQREALQKVEECHTDLTQRNPGPQGTAPCPAILDWFTCSLPCSQPSASSLHCKPGPQQLAGTPGFQFSNTTSAKLLISKCPEKENWMLEGFGICPDWAEHLASDGGVCYEVKSLQYKTLRKLNFVH